MLEGWLQEFIKACDIKDTNDLKGAWADPVGADNSRNGSSSKNQPAYLLKNCILVQFLLCI